VFSKKLTRPSVLTALVAAVLSLVAVAPAHAVWVAGPSGYTGSWVGAERSQVQCSQHSNLIFHAGPTFSRTAAYPNSIQTIWIQPRLESFDSRSGRYFVVAYATPGQSMAYPGQTVTYLSKWYGDFSVRLDGIYRVSYQVGWYVGGRLVGSALFYHHDNEINFNPMEGQRVINNGCTMDV
jgi:hypothetical protein